MMEPTIGRIVWIHRREALDPTKPEAAWVANCWKDPNSKHWSLNVAGVNHDGHPFRLTQVPLIEDSGDSDVNVVRPYATWMPYQKGQAAKAEDLERQVAKLTTNP